MQADKNSYLLIHPNDNVIVALKDLSKGTIIHHNGAAIELKENISQKHKIYLQDFKAGSSVYMYGVLVGTTTQDVQQGGGR